MAGPLGGSSEGHRELESNEEGGWVLGEGHDWPRRAPLLLAEPGYRWQTPASADARVQRAAASLLPASAGDERRPAWPAQRPEGSAPPKPCPALPRGPALRCAALRCAVLCCAALHCAGLRYAHPIVAQRGRDDAAQRVQHLGFCKHRGQERMSEGRGMRLGRPPQQLPPPLWCGTLPLPCLGGIQVAARESMAPGSTRQSPLETTRRTSTSPRPQIGRAHV